jgi:hypothetical protein
MAQTAQAIENAVGPLKYDELSTHDNLLVLAGYYASLNGNCTAKTAVVGAAQNSYGALSEHDLWMAILEVV